MTGEQEFSADVIIVGGGPAGLSAALWCAELQLKTILFEREPNFGGQLLRIYNPITNYIGLKTKNGIEMRDHFMRAIEQSSNSRFLTRLPAEVVEIDAANKMVYVHNSESLSAKALIIATGVRRRKLGVSGEDLFQGRGILESGAKEREKVANKKVLIVGGGDAAIENALMLSHYSSKIYVSYRRANLSARHEFVDQANAEAKIEFRPNTIVRSIIGNDRLVSAEIHNLENGKTEELAIDFVLIRIGVEPNTELFDGQIDIDSNGYVIVDHLSETSIRGIFAIGDVANPLAPTIAAAAGTGATAAKSTFDLLNRRRRV